MAPNSYCTIVTVFFVNEIQYSNTYLFTARMSRLLGCSGASAGLGVSAGSGASAGWAGSGGLAAQVLGWGLGPPGGAHNSYGMIYLTFPLMDIIM